MYNRRKLILALTVIFTLNIMIIALAQRADAVTYAKGSSGETCLLYTSNLTLHLKNSRRSLEEKSTVRYTI